MKSFFRVITCLLVLFSFSSCITSKIVSNAKKQANNINKKSVRLTGKTVQMINRHGALMVTDNNDIVCIVYDFDEYYDGMKINGRFHRCGTYEYLFSDGTFHYAPVFVREKDYRKFKIIAEELDATRIESNSKKETEQRTDI